MGTLGGVPLFAFDDLGGFLGFGLGDPGIPKLLLGAGLLPAFLAQRRGVATTGGALESRGKSVEEAAR